MEMWIKTFWPIAWAVLSTLGMLVLALLSKTYAKRDDLAKVEKKVDELKAHVDSLPTQKQITDLLIALERTNGRMESLEAKIQPVQHLAQLLLEQRLKDDK
jgi:predicted  nucleic acid-binding Zn-ribbon protein